MWKGKRNIFKGLHHPAFITGDVDTTIRFWRDLLGMRLVYTLGEPGNRQVFFAVSDDVFISFFEWYDVEPLPYRRHGTPRKGAVVFDHLAISVASEDALWELVGRFEGAGIPISDIVDHGLLRSLYTYDPNGIPLEFSWPVPEHKLVSNPRFMDRSPSIAMLAGSDPVPHAWPDPDPVPEDERHITPGEGKDHFDPL